MYACNGHKICTYIDIDLLPQSDNYKLQTEPFMTENYNDKLQ